MADAIAKNAFSLGKSANDSFVRTTTGMENHHRLYFSDGNIVLSACATKHGLPIDDTEKETSDGPSSLALHDSTKRVVFRVHKSVLASASQVFAGMLELPEYANVEMHEGAPLVHMPDTAEEIECMIDTLYGGSFVRSLIKPGGLGVYEDLPTLVGTYLEVAKKYDITSLKEDIADIIAMEFPSDLRKWDCRDKYRRSLGLNPPEPASLVAFANKHNLPQVRALALYELCRRDPCLDWDRDCHRGDMGGAKWELLTCQDYRDLACIQELQRDVSIFEQVECETCFDADKHQGMTMDLFSNRDFLRISRQYEEALKAGVYCEECSNIVEVDAYRTGFWEDLQSIGRGDSTREGCNIWE